MTMQRLPHTCPRCGRADTANVVDFDEDRIYVEYRCDDCGTKWAEEYTLGQIIQHQPPTPGAIPSRQVSST